MSLSTFVAVGGKRTVALSPEHIHRESTKISVLLKHIQVKVIKSNKTLHK